MNKCSSLIASLLLCPVFLFSQENTVTGKAAAIDFFSDDVPRYEGFAIGVSALNQWPLGDYAAFAN